MRATIDDQELAMTLLSSLLDEIKFLIIAIYAVNEESLSFEKAKGILLSNFDRNNDIMRYEIKRSQDALSVRCKFLMRKHRFSF